jgi:hypothetical protein
MPLIFSFLLYIIARSIYALRLRRFIACKLSTIVGSLIVTITLRCVCIGGILVTYVFIILTSSAPLATIIA